MIEVTMTVRVRMTEKHYKNVVEKDVNDIKSRKLQRELMEQEGVLNVTATVQVIKPKNK
jgi:hypothetical protein